MCESFPYVDIILGTFNIDEFGDLLDKKLATTKSVIEIREKNGEVTEGIRPMRSSFPNAWVNVMYGCNNFCSYCIIPYLRGRSVSREKQKIKEEKDK